MAELKIPLRNMPAERKLCIFGTHTLKPGEAIRIQPDRHRLTTIRVWSDQNRGKAGFNVFLPGESRLPWVERFLIRWEIPVGGSVGPWMLEHGPKDIKQLEKISKSTALIAKMPVQNVHVHHVMENGKPVIILENREKSPVRISTYRW